MILDFLAMFSSSPSSPSFMTLTAASQLNRRAVSAETWRAGLHLLMGDLIRIKHFRPKIREHPCDR